MSVKAQFVVVVGEQTFPVEIRYEPNALVDEIKKLIVAELKSYDAGFDSLEAGYLTLKTLEGYVIMADEMPKGDEFLAEILIGEFVGKVGEKIEFGWREPRPLLQTEGSNWNYQADPRIFSTLRKEISLHYAKWCNGAKSSQSHPLFLCLSGPGTGKSRLLTEFPRLVKESVTDIDGLKELINNNFCFNVSFENETWENPVPFDPSKVIGTRMMYQLQDKWKWSEFRQRRSFSVPRAIAQLASLTNQDPSKMCVILCIDGLQKLEHSPGSKKSALHQTINAVCSVVNDSDAFVIAVCSATLYMTINEVLFGSSQRRVLLVPPYVNPQLIFESKDELTMLLASDMGGHGRALEILYTTLRDYNIEDIGFVAIQKEVVARIRMAYPDIVNHIHVLEKFMLHVIARRKASSLEHSQLDALLNLGMFRLKEDADLLEFPYILWLIWRSKNLPWAHFKSWAPSVGEDVFATWEEWENFNCNYRIIKSKAFGGYPVRWMDLHKGAKFGPLCDEIVNECALEYKKFLGHVNTASKPVGKWIGIDPCNHGSDTIGRCIQVGHHSPSGNSYVCLKSEKLGWIHEVYQDKHTDSDITYEQFCKEREKSAADVDYFILFSTGKVDPKVLEVPRSAFVDISCWSDYYGPFAARALFVQKKLPPLINVDDT